MGTNNTKFIAPLFVFLFIFITVFLISLLNKEKSAPTVVEAPREAVVLPIDYSRVSFFLGQPIQASLAIPANWEGKYRLKHAANYARFYYIGSPGEEILFFSVYLLAQSDWQNRENKMLIRAEEKDGWVVAYDISTDNIAKTGNQDELQKMSNEANELIKNIIVK